MEKEYRKYHFEDLAKDPHFRSWVIDRNPESRIFWEQWLAENPDMQKTAHLARAFLLALEEKDTRLDQEELENITDQIVEENQVSRVSFWQTRTFRMAAALLLFSGLGYLGYTFIAGNGKEDVLSGILDAGAEGYQEESNTGDQIKVVNLIDGSKVSLYPQSKLRYPKSFSMKKRSVYLTGKAFFDIHKNPGSPFWVYTEHISTQVLGTSFMVSAFENTKDVKVEVKTGRVSVYTRKDLNSNKDDRKGMLAGMVLTPNQQVTFSKTEARLIKSIVEQPEQIVEIPKEQFRFEETSVSNVFSMLEKAYGISIIFDAQNMIDCYLTATLEEENLYEKLDIICKVTHSYYEIVDAQIIIHSRGC